MRQEDLFEPIEVWLENKGFRVLVTHNTKQVGMFMSDLLSTKSYVEPDLAGIFTRDKGYGCALVVEVETDPRNLFQVIGKCMLWKTTASYVYIAFPKRKCPEGKLLEKLGIGLLSVSDDTVEEVIGLEDEGTGGLRFNVGELHPLEYERESQLFKLLERVLVSRS